MTIAEFARSVVNDPAYRESVLARAKAGTLPPEIEMLLLECAEFGDRHLPISRTAAPQSKTFALVRPPAPEEAQS